MARTTGPSEPAKFLFFFNGCIEDSRKIDTTPVELKKPVERFFAQLWYGRFRDFSTLNLFP